MTKKITSFIEYFSSILQQYHETQQKISPPTLYRLVNIKEKENDKYELLFQLIGKSVIFKATPEEILKNEKIIEYFSSKDISTITQLIYKKLKQPNNIIVSKYFSQKLNKLLFKVKHLYKESGYDSSASELSANKEFIRNLGPEDAHMIGYAAAMEMLEDEKIAIKQLAENKNGAVFNGSRDCRKG